MGLGALLTRDKRVTVTDTASGQTVMTVIADNSLSGGWGPTSGSWWGAAAVPAAWRACTLIADLIARMPWDAVRDLPGGLSERVEPLPPVLEQPAPPWPRFDTVHSWVLDLVWNGNAVALIAALDPAGIPTALVPVPAELVSAGLDTDTGRLTYRIGGQRYDYTEVFHVRGPHRPGTLPGDLRGKGVLELHLESLNLARDQRRQAAGVATHGVPSGVLTSADPDLDETGAAVLKAKLLAAQTTRQPLVLNPQTTFQPIAWNPEELELVEARKMSNADMALVFGVPGYFLGADGPSMTYSNVTEEGRNLVRFSSVAGHIARFEAGFSALLPLGIKAKVNLDALLREDTKTRYEAHAIALSNRFLTVDEVRELEDRPPLPDQPAPLPGDNPPPEE